MKNLFNVLLLTVSGAASADCLVELSSTNEQPFIGQECRDALRDCNRFKRTNGYDNSYKCVVVDRDYGGYDPVPTPDPIPTPIPDPVPNPGPTPGSGDIYSEIDRMDPIEQAYHRIYEGLYVKKFVDGIYHQIYVNGNFSGNYDSRDYGRQVELKRRIRDLVRTGQYPLRSEYTLRILLGTDRIINQMASFHFENCYVKPNVQGYHQLYVAGVFRGNYDIGHEARAIDLKSAIAANIEQGNCRKKPRRIIDLMNSPTLLDDMIHRQYRNCYVKPYVNGIYHQLYVNNQFKGNYDTSNEFQMSSLMSGIVSRIEQGICQFDPI